SRDDLRAQRETLAQAEEAAQQARSRAERVERELQDVSRRREAAEEKLAQRSAHREELSRRLYVAQSAGERVSYRAEAVRAVSARIDAALDRSAGQLAALESQAQADVEDPEAHARIARLETELNALERDREAELARQIKDLEQQLAAASAAIDDRGAEVERARIEREQADTAVEQAREAVRSAERGVEAARREAARVGGELAAVNQFLRAQTPLPGAATALSDELEVDAGYELALAAALDGRLRAAVVGDRSDGAALLDRAGAEGGRALVAPSADAAASSPATPPSPGAERLADRIRGADQAVRLARSLLRDTWVVGSLDEVPERFAGVAVTRAGRVWSGSTRELRQAPAVGEERVLAERNRRDQLIAASEAAAQAEQLAKATLEQAGEDASRRDADAERVTAVHRAAVRARDEVGEERRRIEAMIEHRRAAPDDGPEAGRRLALTAQLGAERDKRERIERERAERQARLERARQAVASAEALRPGVARVLESLAAAAEAIAQRRATFEEALASDREAGEHVAAELKACAQREATLHTQLHSENEARTETQVRL